MPSIADRVRETTTTTGTGTVNLEGAVTGFQMFSNAFTTGTVVYYCISDGTNWEIGYGAVTTGSPWTLARSTVLQSSNADALVDFGSGIKDVFCTMPAAALDLIGTAAGTSNTPAGNIAATTVQAAINELDTEKALLAGSTTQSFSMTTAAQGTNTTQGASTAFVLNEFGKHKNYVINGAGLVMQRGSVTLSNGAQYGQADRHLFWISAGSAVSGNIQSLPVSSSGIPGTSTGQLFGVTGASWTTGSFICQTRLESLNVINLNGKTITVSAKVYQNTGGSRNMRIAIYKPTTTVDTFSAITLLSASGANAVPSGLLTTISATFTLGSADASLGLAVNIYDDTANTVSSKIYMVGDFQLEEGSAVTQFEHRPYGMELALCQRYYYRVFPTNNSSSFGLTYNATTTSGYTVIPLPVQMRAAPSALEQDGTAAHYGIYESGGVIACSAVPTHSGGVGTNTTAVIGFTVAAGLTVNGTGLLYSANSAAYLGWSAEL